MPLAHNRILLASAAFGVALPIHVAHASSPEAWEAMRKDVEASCTEAASPILGDTRIVVDPFGSESYGIAFLTTASGEAGESAVCIYDKQSKSAEIGGTMALENAVPELAPDAGTTGSVASAGAALPPPAPGAEATPLQPATPSDALPPEMASLASPVAAGAPNGAGDPPPLFAGRCDAACATTLAALSDSDRAALTALPERVHRTVAASPDASLAEGAGTAREGASAIATVAEGGAADGIAAPDASLEGTSGCTLYYFGYSGETARRVGSHQCSVSQGENGGLVVEKTSGERLRAEIRPLTAEVSAFLGRTYDGGNEDAAYDPAEVGEGEFGNASGFAVQREGQLLLVSAQQRRFDAPEDFFWVLSIDAP